MGHDVQHEVPRDLRVAAFLEGLHDLCDAFRLAKPIEKDGYVIAVVQLRQCA